MRGGLSVVVRTATRGAAAFAEGARTNLMIFFSFAFIPSPITHSLIASLALSLFLSMCLSFSSLALSRARAPSRSAVVVVAAAAAAAAVVPALSVAGALCSLIKGLPPTPPRPLRRGGGGERVRCEFRLQTPVVARGVPSGSGARVGGPGRVGRVCGGTHSLSLNCTNMQFYFLGFYPLVVYC